MTIVNGQYTALKYEMISQAIFFSLADIYSVCDIMWK